MTTGTGTKPIGAVWQKPLRHSSLFVEVFGLPTPAWLIYRANGKKMVYLGHLKRFAGTRLNGLRKSEGVAMEMPLYAERGFLRLLLTSEQAEDLKKLERAMPDGRFLIPFEVRMLLKIPLPKKVINDFERQNMQRCWYEFCRATNLDQGMSVFHDRQICEDWMDYIAKHYQEPLPVASGWDDVEERKYK